jgi:hypothetical protein
VVLRAKKEDKTASSPHQIYYSTSHDVSGDAWRDLVTFRDSTTVEFYWAREAKEFSGRNQKGLEAIFAEPAPPVMRAREFFDWSHRLILEQVGGREPDLLVTVPSADGFAVSNEWAFDLNRDGYLDWILPYIPFREESYKYVILVSCAK